MWLRKKQKKEKINKMQIKLLATWLQAENDEDFAARSVHTEREKERKSTRKV